MKSGTILLDKEKVVIEHLRAATSQVRALKFTIPMDKAFDSERIWYF
jgi:hypothetical protein